ncbi:MAG: hypothetical protein ACRCUP_01335 [Mycoplasmatales bacterium]
MKIIKNTLFILFHIVMYWAIVFIASCDLNVMENFLKFDKENINKLQTEIIGLFGVEIGILAIIFTIIINFGEKKIFGIEKLFWIRKKVSLKFFMIYNVIVFLLLMTIFFSNNLVYTSCILATIIVNFITNFAFAFYCIKIITEMNSMEQVVKDIKKIKEAEKIEIIKKMSINEENYSDCKKFVNILEISEINNKAFLKEIFENFFSDNDFTCQIISEELLFEKPEIFYTQADIMAVSVVDYLKANNRRLNIELAVLHNLDIITNLDNQIEYSHFAFRDTFFEESDLNIEIVARIFEMLKRKNIDANSLITILFEKVNTTSSKLNKKNFFINVLEYIKMHSGYYLKEEKIILYENSSGKNIIINGNIYKSEDLITDEDKCIIKKNIEITECLIKQIAFFEFQNIQIVDIDELKLILDLLAKIAANISDNSQKIIFWIRKEITFNTSGEAEEFLKYNIHLICDVRLRMLDKIKKINISILLEMAFICQKEIYKDKALLSFKENFFLIEANIEKIPEILSDFSDFLETFQSIYLPKIRIADVTKYDKHIYKTIITGSTTKNITKPISGMCMWNILYCHFYKKNKILKNDDYVRKCHSKSFLKEGIKIYSNFEFDKRDEFIRALEETYKDNIRFLIDE